jgi:photosystem II stability/assembly factor-like uncharacterized protein
MVLQGGAWAEEKPADLWVLPGCKPMPTKHQGPFVRLKDGGILTVDATDALVSRDEGQTWQAYPMFADPQAFKVSSERAVLCTREGHVVVAFMNLATRSAQNWDSKTKDFVPEIRLDVCTVRSLDGGQTWRDAQVIQTLYAGCVRALVQARDDSLVIATQQIRRDPAHYATTFYYSTDDGAGWQTAHYVDVAGKSHEAIDIPGHGHHDGAIEPTVEVLKDGRLWMLIRTGHDWFWQAFSYDNGRTWRDFDRSVIGASAAPGLLKRLHDGRLLLVWNQLYPEGRSDYERRGPDWHRKPASYHREELSVAFSDDDGQHWSKPLVIARRPGTWLSYPYVFERQPGELWISTMQGDLRLLVQEADLTKPAP